MKTSLVALSISFAAFISPHAQPAQVAASSAETMPEAGCQQCWLDSSRQGPQTQDLSLKTLPHLFASNRAWAQSIREQDPDFFQNLARQQAPQYLWIGCSDSRVPANQIVGLLPGELFVHRNLANVVAHTDLNCLSVMQFAVDVLKVRHVIVCGHYGCAGVKAALPHENLGLVDDWLRPVRDVRQKHEAELAKLPEGEPRQDRLCELNVLAQVVNVCQTSIICNAWRRGQPLAVHGWIYGLQDGLLRDLNTTILAPAEVPK